MRKTGKRTLAGLASGALGAGLLIGLGATPASAAAVYGAQYATTTAAGANNIGVCAVDFTRPGTAANPDIMVLANNGTANLAVAAATNTVSAIGDAYIYEVSGAGRITSFAGADADVTTNLSANGQLLTAVATTANTDDVPTNVRVSPTTADGSFTVTISTRNLAGGAVTPQQVINVTAVAACETNSFSAGQTLTQSSFEAANPTNSVDVRSTFLNGELGFVNVSLRNPYGAPLPVGGSLTATATGGALINWGAAPTSTTTSPQTVLYDGDLARRTLQVAQPAAGAPLTTTITLTFNGQAVATKTITITGAITEIRASSPLIAQSGQNTAANAGAFQYALFDAAGNQVVRDTGGAANRVGGALGGAPVPLAAGAITQTPSTVTALVSGAASNAVAPAQSTANGGWTCAAATGSADISVRFQNAVGAFAVSNVWTAKCAGGVDTYTATLDKAQYRPGELARVTITAKDATGAPVNDFSTLGDPAIAATFPAIGGFGMNAVVLPTRADTFTDGSISFRYIVAQPQQMPVSSQFVVDLPLYAATSPAVSIPYTISNEAPPEDKTLAIGGARTASGVSVVGEATGFKRGDVVNVEVRVYNNKTKKYKAWKGAGTALIRGDGSFTATISTSKKVRIKVSGAGVTSNVVTVNR